MLAWTIYISFLGVAVLMCLPAANARAARLVAMLSALIGLGIGAAGFLGHHAPKPGPADRPRAHAPHDRRVN